MQSAQTEMGKIFNQFVNVRSCSMGGGGGGAEGVPAWLSGKLFDS